MRNLKLLLVLFSTLWSAHLSSAPWQSSSQAVRVTSCNEKKYCKKQLGGLTFFMPRSKAVQTGEAVKVTINYDFPSGITPLGVSIYNSESGMFHVDYVAPQKSVTQSIPKGVYDMFASYMSTYGEVYYVFREQVTVEKEMSLTLSQSEAKVPIAIRTVDHNGSPLHMPVYNTSYQIVEPGTADDFSSMSFFILKGFGNVAAVLGGGYKFKGHDTDFFINPLSDRYQLCEARMISLGDTYWFNKYVVSRLDSGQTITNDPSRFYKYEQDFEVSPMWKDSTEFHVPGYYMSGIYDGDVIIGQQSYIPYMPLTDYKTKFYLDTPIDDEGLDNFNVLVKPLLSDYMSKEVYAPGDTDRVFYFIRGQQVAGDKEGLHFIAAGYEEDGGFNSPQGSVRSQLYPGHPAFSFTNGNVSYLKYGSNCPINSVKYASYIDEGQEQTDITTNYVGRYGELRDADYFVEEQEEGEETDSTHSLVFTNKNVKVDGLDGKNVTTLYINKKKQDHVPPTLQMLQFKDINGNLTDCFTDPKEGVIEIAGGDFIYHYIPEAYTGYFTCAPVDAKVFYYPHENPSQKTQIDMKEISTLFYMPGYGHFFRGELASVPVTMDKQWYDLEIKLTDTAGNSQSQVICPAFSIAGGQSGLCQHSMVDEGVSLCGDRLVVSGQDVSRIVLYSIVGCKIVASEGNEISTGELPHGVYVVQVLNHAGVWTSYKIAI